MDSRRTAVEQTSDAVIRYIQDHELCDGDRLPSERELCAQLNVSRSTLREAISRLTARNVLESQRGVGVFVSYKEGVADDPLGFTLIRDKERLARDLLEFRILIEPHAAALAARNATRDDIADLKLLCAETERLIREGRDHLEPDKRFHTRIARCSGNIILPKLLPIIHGAIGLFIKETRNRLLEETINTHRAVLDAIRNRDSLAARDAMYLHLVYNREALRKNSSIMNRPGPDMTDFMP